MFLCFLARTFATDVLADAALSQMGQVGSLLTGNGTSRLVIEEGTYEGEYVNGRLHDRGKAEFSDGEVYEDEFVHRKLYGSGI